MEALTPELEDFTSSAAWRTADGRRTAEVTNTTITVFEGGRIIAVVPTTEQHRRYPGSVWDVINGAVAAEIVELAEAVDFIASATAEAASPALRGMSVSFLLERFTTDRAVQIIANAYDFHRSMGDTPERAAGRAGARVLRAVIVIADPALAIKVSRAVEAAHNGQHQN